MPSAPTRNHDKLPAVASLTPPYPVPVTRFARRVASARTLQVLAFWGAATALTLMLARLGAADTPVTVWAPAAPSWAQHIGFWDGEWYMRIWRDGYPTVLPLGKTGRVTQNAWAFLPGLPVVAGSLAHLLAALGIEPSAAATVDGFSRLTGTDTASVTVSSTADQLAQVTSEYTFYVCAALVSLMASAVAAVLADRWLRPHVGETASLWAVGLAWSAPCALVMQVAYAEALALSLILAALLLVEQRHFLAAAPLLTLASFTRPVAVPLTAALALWWLLTTPQLATVRERLAGSMIRSGPGAPAAATQPGVSWELTGRQRMGLAALAAWGAVCAAAWPLLAWAVTGQRDAYTATETAWRGASVPTFLPALVRSGAWVGPHLGWVLVVAVTVVAVAGLSSRYLRALGPVAWCWCVAYCLYLAVVFDPTTSLFRLLIALAPAAWALASALAARGTRTLVAAVACGIAGQALWISWVWDYSSITMQWVP